MMTLKKKSENKSMLEGKIYLSLEQLITFSITLLTIGASVYTLIQTLPKIEQLDTSIQQLRESNARVEQRIKDLKEAMVFQPKK